MSILFGCSADNVGLHLRNIFSDGELDEDSTAEDFSVVRKEGSRYVSRKVRMYNLEGIISVGFRVNSKLGIQFRRWANKIIQQYWMQGCGTIDNRLVYLENRMDRRLAEHDSKLSELRKDVDYFIRSSLPPKEKVFVDGQMLDAQVELTRIVKTAKKRIVLIDNYIDERTLLLLGNRGENVACLVYTLSPNSPRLAPALANYEREFPTKPLELKGYKKSHDRFLIIDDTVWHVGASLKDAGAALFALMKMELPASAILGLL
ncbi:MAG: virulence RhuM family protein [Kiritimatiellae bacterium]|nr:virulence RhuM family protein [Kiritimatiellia bacterium]